MANFQQTLSEEIRRLARKETNGTIKEIKAQLVELRKVNAELNRRLKAIEKALPAPVPAPAPAIPVPAEGKAVRVTAERITKWRTALGLNKAQCAALLEVSPLSLVRWENGKSAPRAAMKQRIAALRDMGRRDLNKLLAEKNIAVKKAKKAAAPKAEKAASPKAEKAASPKAKKVAPKAKKAAAKETK